MANAIDDLRYISRYGYRDPWAEATKNITDSLLAYAKSKNQRDILIAQYKDKEQDREDKARRELKSDNRYTYSRFDNPEDAKEWIEQDNTRAIDIFGVDGQEAGINSLNKKVEVNTQLKSYEDVVKDNKSTFTDRKNALTNARILSTEHGITAKSQAYNLQLQRLQNQNVQNASKNLLTEFADSGYDVTSDKGTWLSKAEHASVMEYINGNNLTQAQTTLNRLFSQKGTDLRYIESHYNAYLKSYADTFQDEDGNWLDENAQNSYSQLRTSLDNRFRNLLPTNYQDTTKSVQENIENAILRLPGVKKTVPSRPGGTTVQTGGAGSSLLGSFTKTPTILKPNKVFNIESNKEILDLSTVQDLKVLNKFTGKEELMSGSRINQLGDQNVEILFDESENKDAYIEMGRKFDNTLGGFVATVNNPKDGRTMTIQNGMTVINKTNKKRFTVGIKETDPTMIKRDTHRIFSAPQQYKEKYQYIVDGKKYLYNEFVNKFGVPLMTQESVKTDKRPIVTGFSAQEVIK